MKYLVRHQAVIRGASEKDFFLGTEANFVSCKVPDTEPDYVSKSGSAYYYTDTGVIRVSNHWTGVASCRWTLDGEEVYGNQYDAPVAAAFCEWNNFSRIGYIEEVKDMPKGTRKNSWKVIDGIGYKVLAKVQGTPPAAQEVNYPDNRRLDNNMVNKQTLINEITSAFSLSGETAETACLLLEARAATLDYTLEEYLDRYHPGGIAEKDENLPERWKGYVQFLGDDAAAVLRAGQGADWGTFVHECAHVFRRQLAGDLREQAEKAFGVENGNWDTDKEELFAKGLEQWIKRRRGKDKTRAAVYNKGKGFVNTVYRGMEYIVEIDPRMEEVYERLFEDNPYKFRQNEYEDTLHKVSEGELPKTPHVFLGMTPRIYEELGFERLPMAITGKHLYSTLRENGILEGVNYHDLSEDILRQLPEQLKKPLLVVQSDQNETDIISIIELKDKNNDSIIVPVGQYQKGNFNGTEIDVNLVRTLYGKNGFEQWLKAAIDDDRLLYIDKKKTEPALTGQLTHTAQDRSILPPGYSRPALLQNVFGFNTENIARYKEEVKRKFPERFPAKGKDRLYKQNEKYSGQLAFDFDTSTEETRPRTETTTESPENTKKRYSLDELNDGWSSGIFTAEEVAGSLDGDDTFQGYPAEAWKTLAVLEAEYKAGKISAKELEAKQSELFNKEAKEPEREQVQNKNATASAAETVKPPQEKQDITIPLENNPENFLPNYVRVAPLFKEDKIEAARFLLRAMNRDDREKTLQEMRETGQCEKPEDFHRYLTQALDEQQIENSTVKNFGTEIEQKTERDFFLTSITKELLENIEKETSIDTLQSWRMSVDDRMLESAKLANLKEIKRQYDYDGGVEFGDNIVKSGEIPAGSTPSDIKKMMIGNAQAVLDAIQQKINALTPDLFIQPEMAEKDEVAYHPYGAWIDFESRLSVQERERFNREAAAVLEKSKAGEISEEEKNVVRRYSGFGGIAAEGERGVLYDYYTSPPVARLTWELLEKAGGITPRGKILEPSCGTGVFLEYAPLDKALFFTGVELDERTAEAAKLLHSGEKTEIINTSFETFNLSSKQGGYDHVIGNAPFGERGAALSNLDKPEEKSLDNYFVSRSLDNLKDGGTMALIAAPRVLENKTNEDFRLEVGRKAQFLGAVKLPDRSFHHTHTQVTPDILLFKKHPLDIEKRLGTFSSEAFKATKFYDESFVKGTYFEQHPEHIAGVIREGKGQWGRDEVKGDITPETAKTILDSFTPAEKIPEGLYETLRETHSLSNTETPRQSIRLSDYELKLLEENTLREGEVKVKESQVFLLGDTHEWLLASDDKTLGGKIEKIIKITEAVHKIRERMQEERPWEVIGAAQEAARKQLSEYEKEYGSLPFTDKDIKKFTREHPAVQGIYEALLPLDDPLLHAENVYRKQVEILDGHNTAVSALLLLRERMKEGTEETIKEFFPDTAAALIPAMRQHGDIFITSEGCFQLREDFISGDAWEKIDTLREKAENEKEEWKKEKLLYGAAELEKAVGWTPIEDADFSPRSSWVPLKAVREWAASKEALGQGHLASLAKNEEGKWGVTTDGLWQEEADPLVYYLNGQKQRSTYYDTEAYNKEHDELFRSFISNHEEYRKLLENEYNRKFKTHIVAPVKTYPVEIGGWQNAGVNRNGKTLKPHQWQSIHHLYRNECGISALGTGFGKTATAVGLMSLLRQEGKTKRVFLQVPNNKVKDWVTEIKDVMPNLKIASIDPEEAGYTNRDKRYAKYQAMARSDADIIIMPESSASEIQLSAEKDKEITERVASLYRMEKEKGTARQKEQAAMKGERKAQSGKTNFTISFEDFGCDALVVDEAHRYKNLFSSSLSRETGLNDGRQSAKAMSLYKKSEYIREKNNGKNVFLLTATPLTNSPLEYYNMMQYVAPEELRRMGVGTIDGFIREFAHIEMGWIYDWGNGQAKEGRILTGFKNLPTLQNLFFAYTDLQNNPEAIGLEKPLAENIPHIIPLDTKQTEVIRTISEKLDTYRRLDKDERKEKYPGENFLTFYSKMRTASLDLELYDPKKYKNWKNPKLEVLAHGAAAAYKETKSGQVIFCDRVFSSDASFNIHEKIKASLVKAGFKEKEIVIVNGFTKGGGNKSDSAIEKEVSKAIADYNAGKYKIIIGSTACIGEGVNLQKNSCAVHHFDIPFRPSDFIQRNGRVDRQGNTQEKVGLHTYLAAGTIDNYSVNLVQRKANWIDQLLRTTSNVFTNPNDENAVDADELLLALTEEWGDKEAALERRKKLEEQKEEKILAAQAKQMQSQMKNLSLALGALEGLKGKEKGAEYQKRITQISSLESSLKGNPVFKRNDVLEKREPFLYSAGSGNVFREGDVLVKGDGTYIVESLNFKKQELICKELLSEAERKERERNARMYNHPYKKDGRKEIKLSEMEFDDGKYSYYTVLSHLEKPDKEKVEAVKVLGSKDFYSLPNGMKEELYGTHTRVTKERRGGFIPVIFTLGDSGVLEIGTVKYSDTKDKKRLNPFSDPELATIKEALTKGTSFREYDKEGVLETLSETIPHLAEPVKEAIEKKEAQEKAASLKDELVKEASVKLHADKNHLKSRIHVVR